MSSEPTRLLPACCTPATECPFTERCARNVANGHNPKYIGPLVKFTPDLHNVRCNRSGGKWIKQP